MVEEPKELLDELIAAKEAFHADPHNSRDPVKAERVEAASRAIMDWRNTPEAGRLDGIQFGPDVQVGN